MSKARFDLHGGKRPRSSRRAFLAMVAIFVSVFFALTLCEYAFRRELGPFVNGAMTVRPAARLVDLLAPAEHVRARGDRIQSTFASVRVAQGCEGVDVMLMFVAGIMAVRRSFWRTLAYCVAGASVLYACNLVRVAGLWFCLRYWPAHFEAMHVIVGQTAIIVVAVALLAGWTRRSAPLPPQPGTS